MLPSSIAGVKLCCSPQPAWSGFPPPLRHLTRRCELVALAATWGLKAAELEPDDRAGSVSSKARASGPGGSEGSPSQETTANESTPPHSVLCCLARRYAPTDVSVAAVKLYCRNPQPDAACSVRDAELGIRRERVLFPGVGSTARHASVYIPVKPREAWTSAGALSVVRWDL